MVRWRPIFSYYTKPADRRWHRNALEWPLYCYEWVPMSRNDIAGGRSRPAFQLADGRASLKRYVPHLWRLRRRIGKMRSERTSM